MNIKSMNADLVTMELTRDEVDILDDILAYYKHNNMPHDGEVKATVESLSKGMFGTFMMMMRKRDRGGVE